MDASAAPYTYTYFEPETGPGPPTIASVRRYMTMVPGPNLTLPFLSESRPHPSPSLVSNLIILSKPGGREQSSLMTAQA